MGLGVLMGGCATYQGAWGTSGNGVACMAQATGGLGQKAHGGHIEGNWKGKWGCAPSWGAAPPTKGPGAHREMGLLAWQMRLGAWGKRHIDGNCKKGAYQWQSQERAAAPPTKGHMLHIKIKADLTKLLLGWRQIRRRCPLDHFDQSLELAVLNECLRKSPLHHHAKNCKPH